MNIGLVFEAVVELGLYVSVLAAMLYMVSLAIRDNKVLQ